MTPTTVEPCTNTSAGVLVHRDGRLPVTNMTPHRTRLSIVE